MPAGMVFFIIGFGVLMVVLGSLSDHPVEDPTFYIGGMAFLALFFYFISHAGRNDEDTPEPIKRYYPTIKKTRKKKRRRKK